MYLQSRLLHFIVISNGKKCKDLETSIASFADEYREQLDALKTEHDRETGALLEELNQKHVQEMGQGILKIYIIQGFIACSYTQNVQF